MINIMVVILGIYVFIIGCMIGSFINVVAIRGPRGMNFVSDRSECPKCKHKLGFFDLIPVLSYIFLRGKCRYCGEKISIQYFLVEFLSGIAYLIALLLVENIVTLLLTFVVITIATYLIVIMITKGTKIW